MDNHSEGDKDQQQIQNVNQDNNQENQPSAETDDTSVVTIINDKKQVVAQEILQEQLNCNKEANSNSIIPEQDGKIDIKDEVAKSVTSGPDRDTGNNEWNDSITYQAPKTGETDESEPLPSGTGPVARECDPSDLCGWSDLLPSWQSNLNQRPKGLDTLVRRNGIPEPLRGEVWQLLSGAHQCQELMDNYRVYLTKSTPAEQIIARDVHRTFPAHENFRPGAGSSSLLDSLFKVCKAYAVYDTEVNYLQSMSFLVAALLLHMPEEQAFCVLVRIMYNYGLRDLFRNNFDQLYLKFFQLDKLLLDHHPDLHQHFRLLGIEPFTYANSWFLSLFTAKLPLNAVFRILDIFLLDSMDTIFRVALSLLAASKRDLLLLDFEGVLKYLRISMPKLYQDQDNVQQLIGVALTQVDLRRLKKYAKEYEQIRQKEKLIENPISRLQRENTKLTENNLRLESDNEMLTRETCRLRAKLDVLEDKTEIINRALVQSRQDCQSYLNTISDIDDEKSRFEVENSQLKAVCRREMSKAESEIDRNIKIVAEYKKISSQLGRRLDFRLRCAEKFIETIQNILRDNESCEDRKCFQTFQSHANEFLARLNADNSDEVLSSLDNGDELSINPRLLQRMTSSESDYADRPVGAYVNSTTSGGTSSFSSSSAHSSHPTSSEVKFKQLTKHIDELEVELARTKLALVESECMNQQLMHDNQTGTTVKVVRGSTDSGAASQQYTTSGSFKRLNLSAFSKINNIISEKISNISQHQPATPPSPQTRSPGTLTNNNSLPNSASTPTLLPTSKSRSPAHHSSPAPADNNRNHC